MLQAKQRRSERLQKLDELRFQGPIVSAAVEHGLWPVVRAIVEVIPWLEMHFGMNAQVSTLGCTSQHPMVQDVMGLKCRM